MEEKDSINPEKNEDIEATCEQAGDEVQEAPAEAPGEAEQKCREYLELAQRVQADFENYKRRNANMYKDALQKGQIEAITAFLPVLDNIERALSASVEAGEESRLTEGVQMVHRQFLLVLEALGVEEIPALGETFDPNLHEAVLREEACDPADAGKVIDTMLKGYRTKDRVLRCAMVKVAQ